MIKMLWESLRYRFPRFIWPWNTVFSGTVPGNCCCRTDLERGERTVQGDTLESLEGWGLKVERWELSTEQQSFSKHQNRLREYLSLELENFKVMRICERNHAFDLEMKSQGKGLTGLRKGGRGQMSTPGLSNVFDYTKLVVLLKWFLVISWPVNHIHSRIPSCRSKDSSSYGFWQRLNLQ